MNQETLLHAIGEIDDQFIRNAAVKPAKQKARRWIAVAACLCFAAAITPAAIQWFGQPGHDSISHMLGSDFSSDVWTDVDDFPTDSDTENPKDSTDDLSIEEIPVLETSDSYYEMVTGASLATYGLPQEITDDMVGETVSFLSGGSAYYQPVDAPTDITLHEYASHPCEGVYVMQQEDRYRIFLYYNPTSVTQSNLMGLDEVYEIFGVTSPDNIAALYETDWHKDKQIGKKITDPDAIRAFYQSSTDLSVCDNDAFQAKQFDSIPESEQPKAHTAFADELRVLCIETVSGFRFYVDVHPDSGWITSSLFYYPVSEEMEQWLQEYLQ